jgi:hypothetical protein
MIESTASFSQYHSMSFKRFEKLQKGKHILWFTNFSHLTGKCKKTQLIIAVFSGIATTELVIGFVVVGLDLKAQFFELTICFNGRTPGTVKECR